MLRIIAERTSAIEAALYAVLQRAKKQGILDRAANARALARFYLGVAKGIYRIAQGIRQYGHAP